MLRVTTRALSAVRACAQVTVPRVPCGGATSATVAAPLRRFTAAAASSATPTDAAAAASTAPTPPADAQADAPKRPERPRPVGRYAYKAILHPSMWETPLPPTITTKEQLDQLEHQGHPYGSTYDMLTCYQLGVVYFDGIPPQKQVNSAAAATASAPTSADAAAAAAPWSLPKNYTQSLLWFTNAAFEGHVPSRTRLGVMYLAGYGIRRDIPIAFQLFAEASASGDRDAMAHLAAMHLQGAGVPKKDVGKAIEWYTKAADRGHLRAQAILAKLLDTPEAGASRNAHMASHWLHESARAGHVESQFLLAQRLESANPHAAFKWALQAAQNDHAPAQFLAGMAHAENRPVVAALNLDEDERLTAAARWFSRASDQGNVHAQARLGFALFNGVGIKQDRGVGVMWLNNAAEANHVDAQLMLGSIAYDEHVVAEASAAPPAAASTPDLVSLGSKEDSKKLQTAKHYFGKVLENANKNEAALPSQLLALFRQRTGRPWLGDINVFLADAVQASKTVPTGSAATSAPSA